MVFSQMIEYVDKLSVALAIYMVKFYGVELGHLPCKRRKEMVSAPTPSTIGSGSGIYIPYPIEVEVGGATVFVLDVDQFYKV